MGCERGPDWKVKTLKKKVKKSWKTMDFEGLLLKQIPGSLEKRYF